MVVQQEIQLFVLAIRSEKHESYEKMMNTVEWCNWSFDECLVPANKWLVKRDCGDAIELRRGDSRNWKAYKRSLEPRYQGQSQDAHCPKCKKEVNAVNPQDNGETWRM